MGSNPSTPEIQQVAPPKTGQPFRFDGQAGDLFVLYLKNIAFTLLTLGIYRFWASVTLRRFRCRHTLFHDGRFDYHATGKERFFGFLKGLLILSPVLAALVVLHQVLLKHGLAGEAAFVISVYAFFLLMFILRPLIMVGAMRFNLSRTSWNAVRFSFDGRVGEAYGFYVRDLLLTILTLGFYWSWHQVNVRRFKARHTIFGGQRFDFHGSGLEYLGLMIGGTTLTYLTLGLFAPWFIAMVTRFHLDHLSFQGKRFRSSLTGLQVLEVFLLGLLATVLTLGLAFPWAMTRWLKATTDSISYLGDLDLDSLRGAYDSRASALAEGLGEAGEALESLGEMLGG